MPGAGRPRGRLKLLCPQGRRGWLAVALFAASQAPAAVQASDRPYLLTSSAAAEEDDDQVWSVETWWQGGASQQVFNLAPEYAFDPTTSIQLEPSRDNARTSALELELKRLFNHIGRDGWGWGLHAALGLASAAGNAWTQQGASLKLLFTLPLFDGDALLHANAGLQKPSGERRQWVASAAFQHSLPWRSFAFVEVGREDRQTLLHAGVRH